MRNGLSTHSRQFNYFNENFIKHALLKTQISISFPFSLLINTEMHYITSKFEQFFLMFESYDLLFCLVPFVF
jgi:hypothetical protein